MIRVSDPTQHSSTMFRSSASRLDYAPKVFEIAYHHWRSIAQQVMESGVMYRGGTLCSELPTIKHSVPWTIIPMVAMVYFTLRSAITVAGYVLDTPWIHSSRVRLMLGNEIYPPDARFIFETIFLFTSLYCIASQAFELTKRLQDYRFLAIFAIDKAETIKPSMLGLSGQDYHKLSVSIHWSIHYARLLSLMHTLYGSIFFYECWNNRLFHRDVLLLTLFHIISLHYWISIIASGLYYYPLVLSSLVYYHRFKADGTLKYLVRLDDCLNKRIQSKNHKPGKFTKNCKVFYFRSYNSLAKCYVRFIQEVKEYQRHYWSFYLSLLFVFLQVIITFMLFPSFTEGLPLIYMWALLLITTAVTINLMLVIYFCRFIFIINRSMAKGLFNVNFRLQQLRWYQSKEYIKLEANCINIRNRSDGFRFYDGKLINSMTFIVVWVNISATYFLVFKIRFV